MAVIARAPRQSVLRRPVITEAIPIAATALMPIVLFPMLAAAIVAATTAPYGTR